MAALMRNILEHASHATVRPNWLQEGAGRFIWQLVGVLDT